MTAMIPITDLSCFQASYQAARQGLLHRLASVEKHLIQATERFQHPLSGPDQQPLYLDWIFLGQKKTPKRFLVLISGTHGVEGFAGSAIQCYWLPILEQQLNEQPDLGIVIIHALNPWGFAWLRRYDHEGIDLNRNFVNFNEPLPTNEEYDVIHNELFCDTSKESSVVMAAWRKQIGAEQFETVITQGQYQHADGLFYGGTSPSWSRKILEQVCSSSALQQAERIAVIDLHTGLGPFGHGEVINDHSPSTPGFDWAVKWYGPNAQSALLGESCSAPKTGLLDYFWHRLVADRGCFVTLEYGTYSLDKLIMLACLEQRYHNSYAQDWKKRDLAHSAVIAQHDFFYPQNQTWQQLVLFRAGQVIQLALQGICA